MSIVRNADCLDENIIAEFVQGVLSQEMVVRLETHIDRCASCRKLVVKSSRSLTPWPGSSPSRIPLEETPEIGAIIAEKYRVDRVMGAGGMGVVVAATHLLLNRTVALKLMRIDGRASAEEIERFMRDARALVRLKSEHAVRVMDLGTLPNGDPYIVMEHLQGEDLGRLVARDGPLTAEVAASYVMQACEAIAEAHRLGIVHRDIKPSNLFITRGPKGETCIKVLDFGLSKIAGAERELSLTQTKAMMGSPCFMAPEQLVSAREADARADIWGLGATLQFLVTGSPPFEAETVPQLSAALLRDSPRGLPSTVDPRLAEVLGSCLEKDPERRIRRAGDLAAALAPFAGPPRKRAVLSATGRRVNGIRPALSRGEKRSGRPRSGIIAGSIAALLVAGVAAFLIVAARRPVVVLMDTTVEAGVYDPEVFAAAGTNAGVLNDKLCDLHLDLRKENIDAEWNREMAIVAMCPDLVVIHRSAFFHVINARVDLEGPTPNSKPSNKWMALYEAGDDKLIMLMGLVGNANPRTKFLVYSRGTDTRWTRGSYQGEWVTKIEKRFSVLEGRITTMSVEGGAPGGSFKDKDGVNASTIRKLIVTILGLSDPAK